MFKSIAARRKPERDMPSVAPPPDLVAHASERDLRDAERLRAIRGHLPAELRVDFRPLPVLGDGAAIDAGCVASLLLPPAQIDDLADRVLAARRGGRATTLIVAVLPSQLAELGRWLERRAAAGTLAGVRLLVANDLDEVARRLPERMQPVVEDNVIRMPLTTEVENTGFRNFYVFSPSLQALVQRIRAFAQNGVNRAYLLGGPGAGKTSLAYYYYLVRNRGRFVSVNLMAENTGDKAAVKSLLCGHVSGAFPGAGARLGAFTQARDGVCFLDESHGITGPVMEVLMEALDNGQFMQFGAAAKQKLDCALLFATNRSWAHLQASVNLDEFTRLGAATLQVPELHQREEDLVAVAATVLARLGAACTSWQAPPGFTREGWARMRECRWHGNARAVTRVIESAFVDCAGRGGTSLIDLTDVEQGITLWEPKTHHSHALYAPGS